MTISKIAKKKCEWFKESFENILYLDPDKCSPECRLDKIKDYYDKEFGIDLSFCREHNDQVLTFGIIEKSFTVLVKNYHPDKDPSKESPDNTKRLIESYNKCLCFRNWRKICQNVTMPKKERLRRSLKDNLKPAGTPFHPIISLPNTKEKPEEQNLLKVFGFSKSFVRKIKKYPCYLEILKELIQIRFRLLANIYRKLDTLKFMEIHKAYNNSKTLNEKVITQFLSAP